MVQPDELRKIKLLGNCSDEQIEALAKITNKVSYKANQRVYEYGETAGSLFIVIKGLVSLKRRMPGNQEEAPIEVRESGELFGAASFMKPQEYTVTAICTDDTELIAIDAYQLFALCDVDPDLGYKIMTIIARGYFERYKRSFKNDLHQFFGSEC